MIATDVGALAVLLNGEGLRLCEAQPGGLAARTTAGIAPGSVSSHVTSPPVKAPRPTHSTMEP
jgi:hypothetical protein